MKHPLDNCLFLTVAMVEEIHQAALDAFGGSPGRREAALLQSAVAAPQATLGGQSVYEDLVDVAAAYLFFLCRNHPFVDGNKRASLGASLLFLRLNGVQPQADGPAWEQLVFHVAASKLDRDATTQRLKSLL